MLGPNMPCAQMAALCGFFKIVVILLTTNLSNLKPVWIFMVGAAQRHLVTFVVFPNDGDVRNFGPILATRQKLSIWCARSDLK